MILSNLPKINPGKKKRIGRGYGTGKGGHTVGFGSKGQKSRGRGKMPTGFEGGQVPLYKKMPKMSYFKGVKKRRLAVVSLVSFNAFKDGDKVTPGMLVEKDIIEKLPRDGVKILANGNLHKKIELEGFLISKGAKEKIEKAGSKIIESKK